MTKPNRGLAHDPLAAPPRIPSVIPKNVVDEDAPEPAAATKPPTAPKRTTTPPAERPPSQAQLGPASMQAGAPKKSYSFYIDNLLLEEARDAVIHLGSDPDGPRNLSALIEEGVRRELIRLQGDLNKNEPFPHRRVALRRGGNTRDM